MCNKKKNQEVGRRLEWEQNCCATSDRCWGMAWGKADDGEFRTQVLCVDTLLHAGSDLNNDNVLRCLFDMLARGKIAAKA